MTNLKEFSVDELGEIWCNLNCFEWDKRLGGEPDGWENADIHGEPFNKYTIATPIMSEIERTIGSYNTHKSWHLYKLGHTEEYFKNWWNNRE